MLTRTDRRRFPVLLAVIAALALALLAILGALVLPATAQAQTAITLVSNIGQAHEFDADLDDTGYLGQGFTVAAGGGDYTLTSIEIPIRSTGIAAADIDSLSVSVWSTDSSGFPSASLQTLANPASITAGTTVTFNTQSGMTLTLEAGKTYAVVVFYDKTLTIGWPSWSGTENAAESGVTGWTIANSTLYRAASGTTWESFEDEVYRIGVNGTAASGDTPTLSTDATLSALSVTGVTLDPSFASDTYAYTASVANDVEEVTVAPTTTDTDATFEYLDSSDNTLADADSVEDGHQVDLDVGDTVFKVKVTAEDDTTTQTYTVTVTRAACTLNEGDIWCGVVTVGEIERSGSTFAHGFIDITGLSAGTFAGETDIPVGSNTYTFLGLYVPVTGSFDGRVTLRANDNFTIAEQATLELHIDVDGTANTLVMSGFEDSTNGQMIAPGTDSDWSSATTVTARLRPLTQGPTITDVAITSTPVLDTDTYGAGETILVTVTFSEAVTVTGEPHVEYNFAGTTVEFPYESGSGTTALVFAYTVAPSDEDDNGIFKRPNGLKVGTGESIVSAAGVAADLDYEGGDSGERDHKVDGSRSIVSVEVTSTPQLETDTYGAGETILFTVTFTAKVDVTGDPVLEFLFDGSEVRQAIDVSGDGTTELVFSYTVVSGDDDDNGLFLRDESDYNSPDGPVRLDSDDEIEFHGTSTDAPLYWAGRGTQSGHKVDGSRTTGNVAPSFNSSATISVAENETVAGTVVATDSDADDSVTGYAITGGADQTFFSIGATSGALTFDAAPNYEDAEDQGNNNTYVVDVTATSGTGTRVKTATQTITVTVTDVAEQSAKPAKPVLAKVTGSTTSLTATWEAPDKNGGPAITGYKLEYRAAPTGTWMDFAHTGTGVTATITGLTADTSYQARVRAENGETDSDWSDASDAVSTNAPAALPTLSVANASGTEGSNIFFLVTLSAAASEDVTVTCTASFETGDTAAAADLSTTTSMATINARVTTGTCAIATVSDTIGEENETFTVTLSSPSSNAQIGTPSTAKGTILDDDDPVVDDNAAPSFSSSATISVAENQTVAGTVLATDSDTDDDVTGYAITGGADQGFFSIGATSGALTFDAAPNHESPQDQFNNNTYVVDVTATSGTGTRVMTATQTITVTVTDVSGEAPGKPGASRRCRRRRRRV